MDRGEYVFFIYSMKYALKYFIILCHCVDNKKLEILYRPICSTLNTMRRGLDGNFQSVDGVDIQNKYDPKHVQRIV